ncbi:MAG: PAS domain S-box protein [Caldilineaceae bacterium]
MATNHALPPLQGDAQLHYAQLLASIDGIFWEADARTFQFTYVSEQAERLLGYPINEWLTPNFWQNHLHPDDCLWAVEFCTNAVNEHRNHSFEYRIIAADGRILWLRDVVSVVMEAGVPTKLRGIMVDITESKQAEAERQAHVWFLESMDKINRAMQGANELKQMLSDVLDTVLAIFACDRAWLLYPCDPQTATWHVPMERTRPEYPGAFAIEVEMPIDPEMAAVFQMVRAADGPVKLGAGAEFPLPAIVATQYQVQAGIGMAIYPKLDKPYLFGLHQCSYPRVWTSQEERLFQEIGRRMGDGLTSMLTYRQLQESELRYREVFEKTSDIMVINEVTADGRFRLLDVNPAWEKLMGLPRTRVIGGFLDDFSAVDPTAKTALSDYRRCCEQKAPLDFERELVTPTGRWYTYSTLIPVSNAAGQIYRLVSIGRNITAQKQAEAQLRASETRFRTFVDHASDAFFLHDSSGKILDANQQACESLGYPREELLSLLPAQYDPDVTPEFSQALNKRLAAGEIVTFDTRHRRKDGSIFPVEVRIRPIVAEEQTLGVALVRDITERKRTQAALTLFRSLTDHIQDSIEIIEPQTGRYLDVNEQTCLAHGYTREEYLSLTVMDIDPIVQSASWENSGGMEPWVGAHVFESQHRRKDGSHFPVEVKANYIRLDRDYIVCVVRDITERKQVEAALKESEARYRTLFDDNPSMYFTLEADGAVSSVNRFGAEQLGYTISELIGASVLNVFYPEDKAAAQQAVQKCLAQPDQTFRWSLRKVRKDGSMLWVEETARAIRRADGSLVVLIVCEDITERKRAEQALVESHSLLKAVFEGTSDAVYVKDLAGRYLMINTAGADLLGKTVEDVIGKDDQAFFTPETAQQIMDRDHMVIETTTPQLFEETLTTAGTTRIYLTSKGVYRDAQGKVIGLIGTSRDVTEQKRLEEQLRQAQKMEAVGRLAGGVAHDFNNLLTVINGYSQLSVRRLSANDPNRRLIGEIQKAGERAANLTNQLLAFSRKQVLQPEVISLNPLLVDLVKLLRRLIGEDLDLALVPDADLGLVKVDRSQFEQTIINLAVNARDAMPQGGRLTIETYNTVLDVHYTERYPEVRPGPYVCVTVSDTGTGMDAVTKARVFEPFFTTKDPGKGTGLGLAMVYGFVKQSGGHVEVYSEVGCGTTFKIYLPFAEESTPSSKMPADITAPPKGQETILLVEDEEPVRRLVQFVLQAQGYTVLEARDGQEALRVAEQHQAAIHLLVTDLVMPHMSGRQLADQLRQIRPNIGILFMSGYTDEAVIRHGLLEANVAFLQKPFNPAVLAHKVRELLDAKGTHR